MCGRFYVDDETAREIERMIQKVNHKVNDVPAGDIHPTESATVISAQNRNMTAGLKKWGFPNPHSKNVIINARVESVLTRKLFRDSVLKRRLIIPAGGFYEWNSAKEKVTFFLLYKTVPSVLLCLWPDSITTFKKKTVLSSLQPLPTNP